MRLPTVSVAASLLTEAAHWILGVYTQVMRGRTIKAVKDKARLTSDAFIIRCVAADGSSYMNIHSAVVPTQQVPAIT